ncbi:MAG: phosphoribosylanthranilate isomerase [Pseudomonadota bacterium]|nr:phosphoribosylanthranilate isomerase [Pseudomonadota bacterium]
MGVHAKICGLNTPDVVDAAIAGGADAVGFVFYPPSPRAVSPETAAVLAGHAGTALKVGLFVDPDDALLDRVLGALDLDIVQLHGSESPERVREIEALTGRPAMKAIKIAGPEDLGVVRDYDDAASWLLFDARPPKDRANALPGGNGVSFDWRLLAGRRWSKPWMLSGGLDATNVAEAVRISGAPWVDVSSGVETKPGEKSPALIARFLNAVQAI